MNYKIDKYRDGQFSARVEAGSNLNFVIRGSKYEDLFQAACIKEAWDYVNKANKNLTSHLRILCLISQRSDRRFEENQSFDLQVVSRFINALQFDSVEIFHPHSDVAPALIHNARIISHFEWVEKAYSEIGKPVLVSPDAGAYKNTFKLAEILGAELVASNKVRLNGEPHIEVQGNVTGLNCLIVDDLADGGRTFIQLAQKLKDLGAVKVFLYVSHGLFSYGFEELEKVLDGIYCTNSYREIDHPLVKQFKVI